MIRTERLKLRTAGQTDVRDITAEVATLVERSGIRAGLVTVFVPGSTAGLTTIEFEAGLVQDLKEAFERLAASDVPYHHDLRWGDGNGFSHVRAALLGPSLSIPLEAGRLTLGTWQQIVLVDMDNRPRTREVIVQIMGE
jgi:secondary thiamine-phosphate synthase enzyme